jgi:hypothetical protein
VQSWESVKGSPGVKGTGFKEPLDDDLWLQNGYMVFTKQVISGLYEGTGDK